MKLVPVPAEALDANMHHITPALQSFADRSRGKFDIAYFVSGIRDKSYQCWMAWDDKPCAVALTIVGDDALSTVSVTHCAGENMHEWAFLLGNIKAWAAEIGSKRLEVISRVGWERVLAPQGLKKTHVILEVDV